VCWKSAEDLSTALLWKMAMAGCSFIRSPRTIVRFAVRPVPRPGIWVTMKGGGRESGFDEK
jgi:hypothetical protein